MRTMFAPLCSALFAIIATTPAQAQFHIAGPFDGGYADCRTHGLKYMTPLDKAKVMTETTKTDDGKKVVGVVDTTTLEGESHRYIWSVSTQYLGWIRLRNKSSGSLTLTAWNFVCDVTPTSEVAHTCPTNFKSPSGSCTICGKRSCSRVTYSVTRQKQ